MIDPLETKAAVFDAEETALLTIAYTRALGTLAVTDRVQAKAHLARLILELGRHARLERCLDTDADADTLANTAIGLLRATRLRKDAAFAG